jgi:phage recombination protein Bet
MNDMTHPGALAVVDEEELIDVMVNSLYPGADRRSAALVLSYCRAANLDPLLKPVHIVPMSVKSGEKNKYGKDVYVNRDTIMPGIGLYRVQASRTGQYAGMDEPVLGEMQEMTYAEKKTEWVGPQGQKTAKDTWVERTIRYPEYAQVTVYRLVAGFRCAFPAREYWTENYATAGRDSDAPNSMWAKRSIGQIIKCAEAQALRKGFPEVGSQVTAEEMEGRTYETIEAEPSEVKPAAPKRASETAAAAVTDETASQAGAPFAPAAAPEAVEAAAAPSTTPSTTPSTAPAPAAPPTQTGSASSGGADLASEGQIKNVQITARAKGINLADKLAALGIGLDETLVGLTNAQFKALKGAL